MKLEMIVIYYIYYIRLLFNKLNLRFILCILCNFPQVRLVNEKFFELYIIINNLPSQ